MHDHIVAAIHVEDKSFKHSVRFINDNPSNAVQGWPTSTDVCYLVTQVPAIDFDDSKTQWWRI